MYIYTVYVISEIFLLPTVSPPPHTPVMAKCQGVRFALEKGELEGEWRPYIQRCRENQADGGGRGVE